MWATDGMDPPGAQKPGLSVPGWLLSAELPAKELWKSLGLHSKQFILMPWKCLCQQIYSFIVKKPISFCFLLLWEFIPPSDLQ